MVALQEVLLSLSGAVLLVVMLVVNIGLIGTVFGRLAPFTGIQRVGASRAEPVKASNPLFAALVAVLVLGERMTTEHLLGVVLIVVDLGFPLLASLLFAVEPTVGKIGLNEGTPVFVGLAIKTVAVTLGYVGYLRWHGRLPSPGDLLDDGVSWYVAAGLANTAFIVALYTSLSLAPVVLVAPLIQASPLFVVVLSYVFLQDIERVTARLALGVTVVVAGGALVAAFG